VKGSGFKGRTCLNIALYVHFQYYIVCSGFGGLEVAWWPLVPKWSRGSVVAFGTQVV